jgi:hypothetical protein
MATSWHARCRLPARVLCALRKTVALRFTLLTRAFCVCHNSRALCSRAAPSFSRPSSYTLVVTVVIGASRLSRLMPHARRRHRSDALLVPIACPSHTIWLGVDRHVATRDRRARCLLTSGRRCAARTRHATDSVSNAQRAASSEQQVACGELRATRARVQRRRVDRAGDGPLSRRHTRATQTRAARHEHAQTWPSTRRRRQSAFEGALFMRRFRGCGAAHLV